MAVGTSGAEVVVGDELHDVGRAELGHSALVGEGKVVRLESFEGTQGTGARWRCRRVGGVVLRNIWFGVGLYRADSFDGDIRRREVAIEKCRVGTVVFLNSAYELG